MKGLFYETSQDKSTVVYTLKEHDHEGYPSLYRLYMATNDPTEYAFAIAYLDSWDHWERITSATWFKPYIERWRRELQLRYRSEALARIHIASKSDDKNAFAANKFLLEGKWDGKEGATRGRPSKEQIAQTALQMVEDDKRVEFDFERVLGGDPN